MSGAEILERLTEQIADLQRQVAQMAEHRKTERAIALLSQHGDPTHSPSTEPRRSEAAALRTVRREIHRGIYSLEQIPKWKDFGIPIEQFYPKWTP